MMRKTVRISIQSVTDLITNSSSEVFITSTTRTEDIIKSLCQQVIGPQLKVEDVFDFKYRCTTIPTDEEGNELEDYGDYEYGNLLNKKEFNAASTVDNSDVTYHVISKQPEFDKFAEELNALVYSYDREATWC